MTMPKKGRREIVVDGTTYHWVVKFDEHSSWSSRGEKRLTIQNTETGEVITKTFEEHGDGNRYFGVITPKLVEEIIKAQNTIDKVRAKQKKREDFSRKNARRIAMKHVSK